MLAVFSVSSLYFGSNTRGPMILQQFGKTVLKRTWRLLALAELNVATISWFCFFFLLELPFDTSINSATTTALDIFLFLSLLSVLVIFVERGHIKAPYRTIRSDADLFALEMERSENQLKTLEDIIVRIETNPRISKESAKDFLLNLSTRNDEVGLRSRTYLESMERSQ